MGDDQVGVHKTQSKCTSWMVSLCACAQGAILHQHCYHHAQLTPWLQALGTATAATAFEGAHKRSTIKPGTIPHSCSHLSGEELPVAQCITPEEQSGSMFRAKISVSKDAIKQSQGRVYREAIAVRGEKWSPEANPPGFIACYR